MLALQKNVGSVGNPTVDHHLSALQGSQRRITPLFEGACLRGMVSVGLNLSTEGGFVTGLVTFLKVVYGFLLVFSPVWLALILSWIIGDKQDA